MRSKSVGPFTAAEAGGDDETAGRSNWGKTLRRQEKSKRTGSSNSSGVRKSLPNGYEDVFRGRTTQ